jgi:hypothetical protein
LPGEVFLHVAADAQDWCGASRADPLRMEGLCERLLPEFAPGVHPPKASGASLIAAGEASLAE